MVAPFLSLEVVVFKLVFAALVFSTTFVATVCPFPTAFCEASKVAEAAFFEVDLAFEAAFFATSAAFPPAFLAAFFALPAALAAARTFFAAAAVRPAFCKSPRLALASLATVPNLAAFNFFAVAAPTPGSDVMPVPSDFPAILSPIGR